MSNDLMRFSVAMPEDLLVEFDKLVARRGLSKNWNAMTPFPPSWAH